MNLESQEFDILHKIAQEMSIDTIDLDSLPRNEAAENLRSRINGIVFADTDEWMDPLWVLRFKSKNKLVDMSGFRNLTNFNWVTIGGVGSKHYGIADASGLITSSFYTGSIDIWVRKSDSIEFPSLMVREGKRLELHSQEDQIFEWNSDVGAVSFSRRIYHVTEDCESIYNEISLQNRALQEKEISFYVALRPFSVRGIEPIMKIEYFEETNTIYLNGLLALVSDNKPSAIIVGAADDTALFSKLDGSSPVADMSYEDERGLATIILRYDVELDPAGCEEFFFVSPLEQFTREMIPPSFGMSTDCRDNTISKWYGYSEGVTKISFPNKDLDHALTQAQACLSSMSRLFIDSKPSIHWSEKVKLLNALSLLHDFTLAENLALKLQKECTDAWDAGRSSCFEPMIWGILQCYIYSQNLSFLRQIRPFINRVLIHLNESIENRFFMNDNDSAKLIEPPSEIPSEFEEAPPQDETSGDNSEFDSPNGPPKGPDNSLRQQFNLEYLSESLWLLRNLGIVVLSFDALGDIDRAADARELMKDYLRNLLPFYNEFFETRIETQLEKFTYNKENASFMLELLLLVCELSQIGLLPDYSDVLKEHLIQYTLKDSLVCISEPHRSCSSHLGLRLVQYYSMRGIRYETEQLIGKPFEFLSSFYVLPDYVNTTTKGGMGEDGCSPFASADLIIALRLLLVQESTKDLVFFRGMPDDWFTPSSPLAVKDLPTAFGPVNIEIGSSANQHQVEILLTKLPEEIEVHLPPHIPVAMVKVFGAGLVKRNKDDSAVYIRLVPLSNEVVLTYHK